MKYVGVKNIGEISINGLQANYTSEFNIAFNWKTLTH